MTFATVRAHPNIAFIKYWGNADDVLKIPVNSSLSMVMDGFYTETRVEWSESADQDTLLLNGNDNDAQALRRVVRHLDIIRARLDLKQHAQITSSNNFPMGAGIASSASSFAALTLAAVAAAGVTLTERELTTLARLGSGSAARSIPAGFVEWIAGSTHESSYAQTIADASDWHLVDVVAVVSTGHKAVGSEAGHPTARTSDLQNARVSGAVKRLEICKSALLARDFGLFAQVVEQDSNLMHAVMMTSVPPLFYWQPVTLEVMYAVGQWRREGLEVCYTLDAGPNVHCICTEKDAPDVARLLQQLPGIIEVRQAAAGQGARIIAQG